MLTQIVLALIAVVVIALAAIVYQSLNYCDPLE